MADSGNPSNEELKSVRDAFLKELDSGMKFWTKHSHDEQYGGFLMCLAEDGEVYDTHKYGWMQCRQVWMYTYLYQHFEKFRTPEILDAAKKGLQFIREHLPMRHLEGRAQKRCYFAVTREGKPYRVQRKPFTECFFAMALWGMYEITDEEALKDQAMAELEAYAYWAREDASDLGAPVLEGQPSVSMLNRPMMLLNLILLMVKPDSEFFARHATWCIERILKHSQGGYILEILGLDDKPLEGSEGRHLNPGHAMEASWFLMEYWRKFDSGNSKLLQTAIDEFLTRPLEYGWDEKFGGVFMFLDRDGYPPVHLEWDMKLWWPHCEGMIACLMAYQHTGDAKHWKAFRQLYDYSFKHYPDAKHGEWFGYVNRQGEISQTLKAGPYKGCFHTVRCWALCSELVDSILKK
ncbi:N-acylglucosamine 2-epimerase-like [Sycon ciliatum]|uniref:N-acylglucosamine 2-epimerase-like n=1 Tax=Sycon ciliatum TaxID=27933 RepID=UPI0031F5F168